MYIGDYMAEIREFVVGFVGVSIGIVVAVVLLPVVTTVIADANLTGTEATLIGLVPLLVAVGVMMFAVKSLI